MGFREIKAKARGDLHRLMRVSALYYGPGNVGAVACNVRVHTKLNKQQGDLAGTNFSYAEQEEHIPAVLFWRSEVDPVNKTVVMISQTEGYRINHVRQADGLTVLAEVVALTNAELGRYEWPEGAISFNPNAETGVGDVNEWGDFYDSL